MEPIKIIDDLYLPILAGLHIYPDESGVLHRIHRGSDKVCEVNKHKLCLPTDANLKALPQTEYMFYHPMSENIARGDSVVYNYTKLAMTLRVNYTIIGLATILLQIANDKTLDGKLKSNQLDLLAALPKLDKKTVDHFNSVIDKADLDSNVFFSVYNRRNGKVKGATYNRAAIVRFPLIEQLNNPTESEFWTSIKGVRKADYANYLALFNYMLPDWEVENSYSGVSDSMEAPSFHALVDSFVRIMKRLNEVMDKFKDIADIEDIYSPEIPAIEKAIGQLQIYANIISPLEGNMGECAANDAQVNQLQQKPIGIPPVGLTTSAESKFDTLNHPTPHGSAWHQTQLPPTAEPAKQNAGFITPQPAMQVIGYDQFGQPIRGFPMQVNGGFATYPTQQPPAPAGDALQQWNSAVAAMNQPQNYFGGGFGQQSPYGQYQNFNQGGFGQQSPYGQYQNFNQGGFGGGRPVFRKQGETQEQQPANLPPTFGQSQPTFGQPNRPVFRTTT